VNLIFLTSESAHHIFLINEIHKVYPVKKVFFQEQKLNRRTWGERFKRWRKPENISKSLNGIINRILFNREEMLERQFESESFFNGQIPELNPSINSKRVSSFNNTNVVEEVKREDPDLIIVFGTDILKGDILNIARLDILNIHRGIAPKYCGGSVVTWAFYNNDFDHLGVTIHVCGSKLDSGDIVGQQFYQLQLGDNMHTLRYRTTVIALTVLKKVLDQYLNNSVEYQKQMPTKIWTSRELTIGKKIIARQNLKKYVKNLKN